MSFSNFATYGFFAAALLIVLGLLGTQASGIAGYQIRIVQSGSMEPALKTGSLVLIIETERYTVGDIITFTTRGETVPTTHRVIEEQLLDGELAYLTKGDANEEADLEPVQQSRVLGKVAFGIPYLGYLIDFARQPIGFVLLVVLPGVFVVFEEFMNIRRTMARTKASQSDKATTTDEHES